MRRTVRFEAVDQNRGAGRRQHWAGPSAFAALLASGATAAVGWGPAVRVAYSSPSVPLVLGTVEVMVAGTLALVTGGRLRRRRTHSDLLLCMALVLIALADGVRAAWRSS